MYVYMHECTEILACLHLSKRAPPLCVSERTQEAGKQIERDIFLFLLLTYSSTPTLANYCSDFLQLTLNTSRCCAKQNL